MLNNSFEKYNRVIANRNRIRWISVFVYISLVLAVSLLPLIIDINETDYAILLIVMILGAGVFFFYVILFPYYNEVEIPQSPDGELIEGTHGITQDSTFYEEIRLKLVYILVVPFLLLFAVLIIFFLLKDDMFKDLYLGLLDYFLQ